MFAKHLKRKYDFWTLELRRQMLSKQSFGK